MSKLLSGNTTNSQEARDGKIVHKSPTTNSYGKCVDALAGQFTPAIIAEARRMIERHDQNSFEEARVVGSVYEEADGARTQTMKKILHVKGTYTWVVLAHLKTIEMWIGYTPA